MTKSARKKSAVRKKVKGKGKEEFRASHDKSYIIPKKIDQTLQDLGDAWLYEQEFLRTAGIANTEIASFRDQYEEYIVYVDRTKRVWCGTKEYAEELRELAQ